MGFLGSLLFQKLEFGLFIVPKEVRKLFFKHFDGAAQPGNHERPLPSNDTFRRSETWASCVREGEKVP